MTEQTPEYSPVERRAGMMPGFYPDVHDRTLERYWDGVQWTPETRPSESVQPVAVGGHRASGSRRKLWLVAAVIAVLVAGGVVAAVLTLGGSSSTPVAKPKPFDVTGQVTLTGTPDIGFGDGDYLVTNGFCQGEGGYDDLVESAQVTVSDESGKTLALGYLGAGKNVDGSGCVFPVNVSNVPGGHPFYKVEVTHRGQTQYTESDLKSGSLDLTIGT